MAVYARVRFLRHHVQVELAVVASLPTRVLAAVQYTVAARTYRVKPPLVKPVVAAVSWFAVRVVVVRLVVFAVVAVAAWQPVFVAVRVRFVVLPSTLVVVYCRRRLKQPYLRAVRLPLRFVVAALVVLRPLAQPPLRVRPAYGGKPLRVEPKPYVDVFASVVYFVVYSAAVLLARNVLAKGHKPLVKKVAAQNAKRKPKAKRHLYRKYVPVGVGVRVLVVVFAVVLALRGRGNVVKQYGVVARLPLLARQTVFVRLTARVDALARLGTRKRKPAQKPPLVSARRGKRRVRVWNGLRRLCVIFAAGFRLNQYSPVVWLRVPSVWVPLVASLVAKKRGLEQRFYGLVAARLACPFFAVAVSSFAVVLPLQHQPKQFFNPQLVVVPPAAHLHH